MGEDDQRARKVRIVKLPSDEYQFECWKVRVGSSVRSGETVALAKRKDFVTQTVADSNRSVSGVVFAAAAATSSVDESDKAQHKRPTRRKRPGVSGSTLSAADESTGTKRSNGTDHDISNGSRINHNPVVDSLSSTLKKRSVGLASIVGKLQGSENRTLASTAEDIETERKDSSSPSESKVVGIEILECERNDKMDSIAHSAKQDIVPILAECDGLVRVGVPPDLMQETESYLIIGFIEECRHPTVVDNLCAVCGALIESKPSQFLGDPSPDIPQNMSQVTVAGHTIAISEAEGQRIAEQDAERLRRQRKLSLILDLDHTLVHATSDTNARQYLDRADVRSLLLPFPLPPEQIVPPSHAHPPMWMQHFVKLRPYVKEFLEMTLTRFEVGVYTAGTRDYAEQITLMLSRQMVDARLDQVDLDRLRHELKAAEAEFDRFKTKDGKVAQSDVFPIEASSLLTAADSYTNLDDALRDTKAETINEENTDDGGRPRKRRKKVTFEEFQSAKKTDSLTAEKIAEIRRQLEVAEGLEAKAQEMRQRLFGSRVVSRTDVSDLGRDVKSLKRIFPCGGTMAVVVDDREDVWANANDMPGDSRGEPPENLLLVRPYHWDRFLGFADVNNAAGVDLTLTGPNATQPTADTEHDRQLLWTRDVLQKLHNRFYGAEGNSTVARILRDMRREVLSGSRIVLSGLIPLHRQNSTALRPAVIRYVECLGATLQTNVSSSTTHIVAAKDGTDKILAARKVRGCFVVKVSWLMECVWTLTRRDERLHLLGSDSHERPTQPMKNSHLENISSSSSNSSSTGGDDDDDDDELAATFEDYVMTN